MEDTSTEFVGKKEGLVWAIFIVFIVLLGFVAVLGISSSSITNMAVDTSNEGASTLATEEPPSIPGFKSSPTDFSIH